MSRDKSLYMDERPEPLFRDALFRAKKKKGRFSVVTAPKPPLEASIADTHAHLDMLEDVPLVLARSAVYRLDFICSIVDVFEDQHTAYTNMNEWLAAAQEILPEIEANTKELTEGSFELPAGLEIPRVRIAIGCHPHNAKYYNTELESLLIERLKNPLTCAIGEVGLDYHYDYSPREIQREVFRAQIRLAHIYKLPLILHLREAHDDAMDIMRKEGFPQAGTLLHCYNLDSETLKPWIDQDCYIAFGGPLTFKKNDEVREAARTVPLNRLLTETDAPFMTPEPMRGMICGPEHTIFTATKLAEVYGCLPGGERKAFLQHLYDNALRLLNRERDLYEQ